MAEIVRLVKSDRVYNYLKEDITGIAPQLIDEAYDKHDEITHKLLYTPYGYPVVNWPEESIYNDKDGFDKSIEIDGEYKHTVILPKGTVLCRYGRSIGFFTTFKGTPYSKLGLPYIPETIEYHEYIDIADGVEVECKVVEGIVAAAFNSEGGATQFLHPTAIMNEIMAGKLKEDFAWIE